jgi:hypothetical protein
VQIVAEGIGHPVRLNNTPRSSAGWPVDSIGGSIVHRIH